MSVVVYAPYKDPSSHWRLVEPARVTNTPLVEHLPQVGDASTVVLNRPLDPGMAEQVRLWREDGRRVIVDLDDCFDTVSVNHRIHGRYTTEYLHAACKAASVVTCTTLAIAERYGYGHGVVLRNRVSASMLDIERRSRAVLINYEGQRVERDDVWVGWYGSLGSHPDDPAAAGLGVGKALNPVDGAEFVFVGPPSDGPKLQALFGLEREVITPGFQSMFGLHQLIAEMDIGIVPLDNSPFNDAKSALKGLEFAAMGVPVIASPTPEYRLMAQAGACTTAATPGDWWGFLQDLIRYPTLRAELAANGKAWAAAHTYEEHAGDWRTVWYSGDHATL